MSDPPSHEATLLGIPTRPVLRRPSPYSSQPAPQAPPRATLTLSDRAWSRLSASAADLDYDGHSIYTGTIHYVLALLRANADPLTWADTRPDYLIEDDAPRLAANLPPQWHADPAIDPNPASLIRHTRQVNLAVWTECVPYLLLLADHFGIIPSRTHALTPHTRASSTLEAIGLTFLTPLHPAPLCPHPIDPKRAARLRRKWALDHQTLNY